MLSTVRARTGSILVSLAVLNSRLFSVRAMDCKRADGLNMGYNPHSPEMVAKYGAPGQTDDEGFNPYADTVGPGIYGGRVQRDDSGDIVIGKQYQVRKNYEYCLSTLVLGK